MIVALMLGTTLNPLNSSMIALALVAVADDFDVSVAAASLLVISFYAVGAVAQPFTGRLVDHFGPRRVYLAGMGVAGVASVLAPLSPNLGWLVVARGVLSAGTAVGFPATLAVIRELSGTSVAPARTMGALSIAANGMAALGPVIGGVAVAVAGWQGIFLLNIPLVAATILMALAWLPPDRPAGERHEGGAPRGGRILTLAVMPGLRSVYGRFIVNTVGYYGILFGLPVWLEEVRGLSTSTAGLLMAPLAGFGMLTTPLAARMIGRIGSARTVAFGAILVVAGGLPMLTFGPDTSLALAAGCGAVLGGGIGFTNLGLQTGLYEAAPATRIGTASGLFQTCRYSGAILASIIVGQAFAGTATDSGVQLVGGVAAALAVFVGLASLASRPA